MRFLILTGLLMVVWMNLWAQDVKIIQLKQGTHYSTPGRFYIDKVMDARTDTSTIGTMRAGLRNRPVAINLKNGAASALAEYIAATTGHDANLPPLTLEIDQLKISEKGGAVKEQATVDYEYSFLSKGMKLVSYSGNAYVQTGMDASVFIEKLIRQSVDNTLEQANKQWEQMQAAMKPLVLEVQVEFEKTTGSNKNFIAYSRQRPLTIEDFKGAEDNMSTAAAATYSGLGINLSSQTSNGKMVVKITLSVYADPSRSWMRLKARNAYILNHEQLHFDLAALAACSLKAQIMKNSFKQETMQDDLMKLYQDALDQLTKEQNRYDTETGHSVKKEAQAKWKSNLESQMDSQDCFK